MKPPAPSPASMVEPAGAGRWLPGLQVLRAYQRSWLPRDVVAGVVLTALLVPAGMGYAEASGLPAIYGLYATIVPLVIYAIVGPSRILVLGPDSSLAPLIAAAILPLAAGNEGEAVALAGMLAIFSGALCVLAGLARFGFIAELLSKPVRYGYMNGIALTVLLSQLPKLFGFSVDAEGVIAEARAFAGGVADGETNTVALLIGVACLLVILGFKRWRPQIPGVLVAVVGATVAVGVFGLAERYDLSVVGPLPKGRPSFEIPSVSVDHLQALVAGAIGIALVSFADTSVLSRTFAIRGGYRVDPNQELVALVAANVATGLFQGFSDAGRRGRRRQDAGDRAGRHPGDRPAAAAVPEPGAEPAQFGAGGRRDLGGHRADRGRGRAQAVPRPQDGVRPVDRVLPRRGRPRGDRGHLHRHRPGAAGLRQAGLAPVRRRARPRRRPQGLPRRRPPPRRQAHPRPGALPMGRTAVLRQRRGVRRPSPAGHRVVADPGAVGGRGRRTGHRRGHDRRRRPPGARPGARRRGHRPALRRDEGPGQRQAAALCALRAVRRRPLLPHGRGSGKRLCGDDRGRLDRLGGPGHAHAPRARLIVGQPRAIPSTDPDGLRSGRRIMRNEFSNPTSPARIGTSRAT